LRYLNNETETLGFEVKGACQRSAFMVPPKKMDRVGKPEFINKEKSDNLNAEAPSVDIVAQEEHLLGIRRSVFFQYVQ
jgi:hypothetical protein